MVSAAVLLKVYRCKVALAEFWSPPIEAAAKFCDADEDPNRLACFLAQIGHESGRLRYTHEIWGPTPQQLKYEYGTPLATKLGNFQPGDGKRFLGRGLIQITGRMNYRMTTDAMKKLVVGESSGTGGLPDVPDFETSPEALERPLWAALSAALFWKMKKLNTFADKHDFVTLTQRINGGINGLADRQALFAAAYGALV